MKKILLVCSGVLILSSAIGLVCSKMGNPKMSRLMIENLEALSTDETVNEITCYSTMRVEPSDPAIYEPIWSITDCNGCCGADCYEYKDSSTCTKNNVYYC